MAKGRPSRSKRKARTGGGSVPKEIFMTTRRLDTGSVVVTSYPPDREGDMQSYMEAHRLIPFDYEYGCAVSRQMVAVAVEALETASTPSDHLLASLAILGHSPCSQALNALGAYVDSGKPYAGVARFALEECLAMCEPWCA